ncbi:helix-turn-helix domain-containing protein [bacterium]|nr:helix-turn-helix domain-containing protein [bacterium]
MDERTSSDGLLTVRAAAKLLKIDETLVRRYCRQGRLRVIRAGRDWLIPRIEAEVFALVVKTYRPGRPRKDREMGELCRRHRLPNDIVTTPEEKETIRENIAWFAALTPGQRLAAIEQTNRFDAQVRRGKISAV